MLLSVASLGSQRLGPEQKACVSLTTLGPEPSASDLEAIRPDSFNKGMVGFIGAAPRFASVAKHTARLSRQGEELHDLPCPGGSQQQLRGPGRAIHESLNCYDLGQGMKTNNPEPE